MDTTSLWKEISQTPNNYPELNHDVEVDVAIVGGGITGVTAANQLVNNQKKILILDAYKMGGVTTAYSTGNLYIPVQPFYQSIQSKFDFATAQQVAYARKFAIDYIENTIRDKKIECQFARRPWYAYTNKKSRRDLEKEFEIFQKMDLAVSYSKELPLSFPFKQAIMLSNQARFNPLQYVLSLVEILGQQGCLIFENSRVIELTEKKQYCELKTNRAKIIAKKVILATHTPIGINTTQMFTAPYRSYVVAVRLEQAHYPEGHFWDLDNKGHHSCTHAIANDNKPALLMVAGNHHKTGQSAHADKNFSGLASFLRKHFPVKDIAYQWSAQHYQSADNIPYIGLAHRGAKHTYLATGYFADGLTYGTLAGIMLSDAILEKPNQYQTTFENLRHKLLASLPFVTKENLNVFLQYLKDYPQFSHLNYHDLKPGEGKIVQIDREKCAVSKDENNKLHIVSAVCTHMKCIVNWNTAEKTWDCPCHGSRFTPQGEVIEGPALTNLASKKQQKSRSRTE